MFEWKKKHLSIFCITFTDILTFVYNELVLVVCSINLINGPR